MQSPLRVRVARELRTKRHVMEWREFPETEYETHGPFLIHRAVGDFGAFYVPPFTVTHAQTGLSFFRKLPTSDSAHAAARIALALCSTWEFPKSVARELVAAQERQLNKAEEVRSAEAIMGEIWSSEIFCRLRDLRSLCDLAGHP